MTRQYLRNLHFFHDIHDWEEVSPSLNLSFAIRSSQRRAKSSAQTVDQRYSLLRLNRVDGHGFWLLSSTVELYNAGVHTFHQYTGIATNNSVLCWIINAVPWIDQLERSRMASFFGSTSWALNGSASKISRDSCPPFNRGDKAPRLPNALQTVIAGVSVDAEPLRLMLFTKCR